MFQLSHSATHPITSTPTATYTYDNNGNTTSKTASSGITDYTRGRLDGARLSL